LVVSKVKNKNYERFRNNETGREANYAKQKRQNQREETWESVRHEKSEQQ